MDPERALDFAKAHRDDLLQEAERDRLLRSFNRDQDPSQLAPDPLLARFGDLLVATGARLQARREPQASQTTLAPLLAGSTAPLFSLHYFQYAGGRAATYMFWHADAAPEARAGTSELRGALAWQSLS
jgi:hypothetical protein